MATKAIAIPMEEYMRTSYEYDAEWVDGEIVERSLPTFPHARAERRIVQHVANAEARTGLFASPNQRIRVSSERWRVPDISIFADREPEGKYPSNVYAAIEILSPEDAMSSVLDKFAEYEAMGIPHILLVDPIHKLIQRYRDSSLISVDAIEFPDRGFRLTVQEIFA